MIRPNAEKWAREWGLGPADSAGLYLATARVVSASGAGAEDLMPLYNAAMWALDGQTTTGSEVSRAANEAARLFLSSPTVFECDLLGSSAVQQLLRSSPEVATLNALVSGNMKGKRRACRAACRGSRSAASAAAASAPLFASSPQTWSRC